LASMLTTDRIAVPTAESELDTAHTINVMPVPEKVRTRDVTEMVLSTLMAAFI